MPTLVVVRHGPTVYSRENRFAGWHDTPLTIKGHEDARRAGETLRHAGLEFDVCFTSRLLRAEQTLRSILTSVRIEDGRIERDWRLNERHYGALQGETRGAIVASYGNAQVVEWRRSYDALPPLLGDDDPRCIEQLARFPDVPSHIQPRGERLRDAAERVGSDVARAYRTCARARTARSRRRAYQLGSRPRAPHRGTERRRVCGVPDSHGDTAGLRARPRFDDCADHGSHERGQIPGALLGESTQTATARRDLDAVGSRLRISPRVERSSDAGASEMMGEQRAHA